MQQMQRVDDIFRTKNSCGMRINVVLVSFDLMYFSIVYLFFCAFSDCIHIHAIPHCEIKYDFQISEFSDHLKSHFIKKYHKSPFVFITSFLH